MSGDAGSPHRSYNRTWEEIEKMLEEAENRLVQWKEWYEQCRKTGDLDGGLPGGGVISGGLAGGTAAAGIASCGGTSAAAALPRRHGKRCGCDCARTAWPSCCGV